MFSTHVMAGQVSQTNIQKVSGKSKRPTVVVSLVKMDDYHVNMNT